MLRYKEIANLVYVSTTHCDTFVFWMGREGGGRGREGMGRVDLVLPISSHYNLCSFQLNINQSDNAYTKLGGLASWTDKTYPNKPPFDAISLVHR